MRATDQNKRKQRSSRDGFQIILPEFIVLIALRMNGGFGLMVAEQLTATVKREKRDRNIGYHEAKEWLHMLREELKRL